MKKLIPHRFSFPNESSAIELLAKYRSTVYGESVWITGSHHHALVVVGRISNHDAVFNDDGDVIKQATYRGGFHVDLHLTAKIEDEENPLFAYLVEPAQPSHILAGER